MTGSGSSRRFVAMIASFAILSIVLELVPILFASRLAGILFLGTPLYAVFSSYSPAIAAIITALIFHRDIRAFGWGAGRAKYYLFALIFPVLFFPLLDLLQLALGLSVPATAGARPDFIAFTVSHFFLLLILCLGEEIGWRGFLVPELMEGTKSFLLAGLVSAILWAAWHFPRFLWSGTGGLPLWAACLDMTIGMIGISFVYCWLRLASGSIWPCLLLHTVSDWLGSCWEPLFVTGQAVHGTAGMVPQFGLHIGSSIVLAAIVIWYVKRNPVGQAGTAQGR